MGSFLRDVWPPTEGDAGDLAGDKEVEEGLRVDFGLRSGASGLLDDFAALGLAVLIEGRSGLDRGPGRGFTAFAGIGGSIAGPYTKR